MYSDSRYEQVIIGIYRYLMQQMILNPTAHQQQVGKGSNRYVLWQQVAESITGGKRYVQVSLGMYRVRLVCTGDNSFAKVT